jgi:GDP-4-dehydro-6-deoxy-D-mannose reductase
MSPFRDRSVLVTGAGGFVGPYVVRALLERGARVHGTGGPRPAGLAFAGWHDSDLRDPESLDAAVAGARPDYVLHLAGQSSAARSFEQPVETFRSNALGTWHLLEALRRRAPEARAVMVTSGEIYGPQPEGSRAAEDAPVRPVSPYALSKAAADAFSAIAAERGQDVVRARSFGHTGPGQEPRFVIPAMAEQVAAIEAGTAEPVLKVGNLEVTRDLLDVRDVAPAYLALFERGRRGAAYNVCTGEGVRLSDVIRRLAGLARVAIRIEVDPARLRPADVPYLVGDPGAIERDTAWRASIPLERTLADVLGEWRERVRRVPA